MEKLAEITKNLNNMHNFLVKNERHEDIRFLEALTTLTLTMAKKLKQLGLLDEIMQELDKETKRYLPKKKDD